MFRGLVLRGFLRCVAVPFCGVVMCGGDALFLDTLMLFEITVIVNHILQKTFVVHDIFYNAHARTLKTLSHQRLCGVS